MTRPRRRRSRASSTTRTSFQPSGRSRRLIDATGRPTPECVGAAAAAEAKASQAIVTYGGDSAQSGDGNATIMQALGVIYERQEQFHGATQSAVQQQAEATRSTMQQASSSLEAAISAGNNTTRSQLEAVQERQDATRSAVQQEAEATRAAGRQDAEATRSTMRRRAARRYHQRGQQRDAEAARGQPEDPDEAARRERA